MSRGSRMNTGGFPRPPLPGPRITHSKDCVIPCENCCPRNGRRCRPYLARRGLEQIAMTIQELCRCLCCPYDDRGSLQPVSTVQLVCTSCKRSFPVLDGRPVLLDESRSIFFTEEVLAHTDRRLFSDVKGIKSYLRKLLPAGSWEGKTVGLKKYADRLPEDPLVVVIGCGFTGRMFREMF